MCLRLTCEYLLVRTGLLAIKAIVTGDDLSGLLMRMRSGDRVALEQLYASTASRLLGACLRILGDRADAEDALQETFLSAWRQSDSFDPRRGSAMTWLLVIARNRSVDRLRSRRRQLSAASGSMEPEKDHQDQFDLLVVNEERSQLSDCLEQIDRRDCDMIQAAFFEGFTYADLATRAAAPLGTIKSRIRRALLKLRECLE